MTDKNVNALTSWMACVGPVRLRGWGPEDPSKRRLKTVSVMTQYRSQWRSWILNLSSL